MKKIENILGYTIVVGIICALGMFFAIKGGFANGMQTISNVFAYGISILANLGNAKYLFATLLFVASIAFAVYLFIKNSKKKNVSFIAPLSIPVALFIFFLAFHYRSYLGSEQVAYRLFDVGLFIGFDIVELYAFFISIMILYGPESKENSNVLTKLEKLFGWILLGLEVIAIIGFVIATNVHMFDTIKNLFAYGINVLTNLSDSKYLAIMALLVVALILGIILFFVNLMKGKKVFFLAPITLPIAVFAFCLAYRYRHHLDFVSFKKGFVECCLLLFFGVVAVYAFVTSLHILIVKKEVVVVEEPAEEEAEEEVELKESIQIAKKTKSTMTKYLIIKHLQEFGKEVELNNRANYTKTGLPLADTHYHVIDKEKKVCFAYIYELDGSLLMLLRVPNKEYAKTLKEKYDAKKSAFPKQKYAWYSMPVSDKFESDDEVYAVIDEAFKEVE